VVRAGKTKIRDLKRGYWEAEKGKAVALFGSGGFLEIAVREGNAQKKLKLKGGDRIRIEFIDRDLKKAGAERGGSKIGAESGVPGEQS
jgi:hypothetical protein